MINTRAPDGANKRIEEKKVKNWWIHCWSKQNYPQLANISFKIVLLKNNYRSSKFRDNLTKRTGILRTRSVQREWILEIQGVKSEEKNISLHYVIAYISSRSVTHRVTKSELWIILLQYCASAKNLPHSTLSEPQYSLLGGDPLPSSSSYIFSWLPPTNIKIYCDHLN